MIKCPISTKALVNALAFICFTVQMLFAINKYLNKPTMQSPGFKPFSSLDKPLIILVCKQYQFDYDKAAELGLSHSFIYPGLVR